MCQGQEPVSVECRFKLRLYFYIFLGYDIMTRVSWACTICLCVVKRRSHGDHYFAEAVILPFNIPLWLKKTLATYPCKHVLPRLNLINCNITSTWVGNYKGNCSYLCSRLQKDMLEMLAPQNRTSQVGHVLLFTFYGYKGTFVVPYQWTCIKSLLLNVLKII